MTVDPHAACQPRLVDVQGAQHLVNSQSKNLEDAFEELNRQMQDVLEECDLAEQISEEQVQYLQEFYNTGWGRPKFWVEELPSFLENMAGLGLFGLFCLVEHVGAWLAEGARSEQQREVEKAEALLEKAQQSYANCLRDAMFRASRR